MPRLWGYYDRDRVCDAHWFPRPVYLHNGTWKTSWKVFRRNVGEGRITISLNARRYYAGKPRSVGQNGPYLADDPVTGGFVVVDVVHGH